MGAQLGKLAGGAALAGYSVACLAVGVARLASTVGRALVRDPAGLLRARRRRRARAGAPLPAAARDPQWGAHSTVEANGQRFHVVTKGSGPKLMLFVHGFPECWYSWRFQLARFGGSEYTAVAFDTRGYGQSSKPAGVEAYKIDTLVEDVRSLVAALGFASCILVGHDWGGSVVWNTAARYPDLVDKLVVCNCPHPRCFRRTGRQLLRSWYIFFHQWPALPEWTYEFNDFRVVDDVIAADMKSTAPASEIEDMIEVHKHALAQPGVATASVNYYRAAFRFPASRQLRQALRQVEPETLLIWGTEDQYLGTELTEGTQRWVPNATVILVPGMSHWINQEARGVYVNDLVERFLAGEVGK